MTTVNIRINKCIGKTGRCNSFFLQDTITCSRPELKTYCVVLITYSKFRFSGETPQKRPEIDGITKQTQAYLLA